MRSRRKVPTCRCTAFRHGASRSSKSIGSRSCAHGRAWFRRAHNLTVNCSSSTADSDAYRMPVSGMIRHVYQR
eukprot:1595660-Pleurochrysis_carterae.AAC.3